MRYALTAMFLLIGSSAMHASVIFTLGNNPSGDVNILLNSGLTGTTVSGSPSGFPAVTVNFTSTQTLLEPSSGQARVSASPEGAPLTNVAISLANNMTYGDLIINPFIGGLCSACTGGASTITVTAVASNGTIEAPVTYTGLNVGNGNNFLTITTAGGESILRTSITVPGGINDIRQPRISGPFATAAVPEPASYGLVGSGLVGLMLLLRRKRG